VSNDEFLAYHSSESLKRAFLNQVISARENKVFAKAAYKSKKGNKSDFISWLAPSAKPSEALRTVSLRLGIPEELLLLTSVIYYRINESQYVAEKFLGTVEAGSDLTGCANNILHWVLLESNSSLINHCRKKKSRALIQACGELYAPGQIVDREIARKLETDCRERALSRKIRKKLALPDGQRSDIDLIRPEFCALWGAARAAAWRARAVHTGHWVLLAVEAWFRAEKESFLEKNQNNEKFKTLSMRDYFEFEVAPLLAQELFDMLLSVIRDAAQVTEVESDNSSF